MSNIDRGDALPTTGQQGDVFILMSAAAGERVFVWNEGAWEVQGSLSITSVPDTDSLPEGSTNLYFTDARAVDAVALGIKITATEPADMSIAAGECYLWFNPTNGAGALNMKAKTLDGTVATAAIAIT